VVAIVVAVALLTVAIDACALIYRFERVSVPRYAAPEAQNLGQTWVIVGSDSRARADEDTVHLGKLGGDEKDRADIMIIVHFRSDGPPSILVVPRDLFITMPGDDFQGNRIGVMLADGTETFARALCSGLGIPIDHLVMVSMDAFVDTVDALDGIEVDFDAPVRDKYSGLDIAAAGTQRLDGQQALAYVRARHPEKLVDGQWVPTDEASGAQVRINSAQEVAKLVMAKLSTTRNPITWQRIAWAVSGDVRLDEHTDVFDLYQLVDAFRQPMVTLPSRDTDSPIVVMPTQDTFDALVEAGYSGGCAAG
jgi:LCP family protein required for cell wall assembly